MNNVIIKQFVHNYPKECAREIEHFSLNDILLFLTSLTIKEAAQVLTHVLPSIAAACIESFPLEDSLALVHEIPVRTLPGLLSRTNEDLSKTLIQALPKNKQIALAHSLSFSMQTAGALMSTNVLFLPSEHNVKQALILIRQFPTELTPLLFCIDAAGKLQGMISLQTLMLANGEQRLSHLVQACPMVLTAHTPIDAIITDTVWARCCILPVVDEHELLIGALEYEKIISNLQNTLFNQRKENLVESLTHIMSMFTDTTEDMLNELNQLLPTHKSDK